MAEKQEEKSDSHKKQKKKVDYTKKIRENPWIISTVVLAVLVLLVLTGSVGNCFTGKATVEEISKDKAGSKVEQFAQSQGGDVQVKDVQVNKGFYEVTFSSGGQEGSIFVTKDGKNLIPSSALIPLETDNTQNQPQDQESQNNNQQKEELPKSEKPNVSLYVMSFCPYGNQAEKTMESVYDLLKDDINFNIHYIVNVQGDEVQSLHGQKEVDQNMREVCVKENYGMEKYWDFITYVNKNCGSEGQCWEEAANEAGLNTEEIQSCVDENGLEYMKENAQISQEAGASGSPTMLINGQKTKTVYEYGNPEAYKQTICSAFTEDAKPESCSEQLASSSGNSAPSGSC